MAARTGAKIVASARRSGANAAITRFIESEQIDIHDDRFFFRVGERELELTESGAKDERRHGVLRTRLIIRLRYVLGGGPVFHAHPHRKRGESELALMHLPGSRRALAVVCSPRIRERALRKPVSKWGAALIDSGGPLRELSSDGEFVTAHLSASAKPALIRRAARLCVEVASFGAPELAHLDLADDHRLVVRGQTLRLTVRVDADAAPWVRLHLPVPKRRPPSPELLALLRAVGGRHERVGAGENLHIPLDVMGDESAWRPAVEQAIRDSGPTRGYR